METANDIMEQLMAEMKKPAMLSIRQLVKLRDRARVLERWRDVEDYTERLWSLGYYD